MGSATMLPAAGRGQTLGSTAHNKEEIQIRTVNDNLAGMTHRGMGSR